MSTAELRVVKGGKQTFRTVEVVKRAEADRWDIVEAVQSDIEEAGFPAHAGDSKSGPKGAEYHELCSRIADSVRNEGADAWKAQTVSNLYRVAVAWPRETRVDGATYGAHERMFAREDRVVRLQKLVDRSADGKVNRNHVDLWLSGLKPTSVVGFIEGIDRAVRAVLLSKGKPWSHVADGDREDIARNLRVIASEVENSEGKFA